MNEDNKYTMINQDNIKVFKFILNQKDNVKYKYYKSLMKRFNSINIKGFVSDSDSEYYVRYTVDKQLIRKLKMMSLSGEIKNNSDEDILLQLLQNSIETGEFTSSYNDSVTWYNYDPKIYDYYSEEKRDNDRYIKYQSKQLNQRVKQYNKFRR